MIYARIGNVGDTSARWQAAQIIRDRKSEAALLAPLDKPEELRRLVQYMVYPSFDMRQYPLLTQILTTNGTPQTAPVPVPGACPAG